MKNLQLSYNDLLTKAYNRGTNIMRVVFDDYIYKYVSRNAYEKCCRGHNNSMVQVSGMMTSQVSIRIKTEGANERIK